MVKINEWYQEEEKRPLQSKVYMKHTIPDRGFDERDFRTIGILGVWEPRANEEE